MVNDDVGDGVYVRVDHDHDEEEHQQGQEEQQKGPPKLFIMNLVNSYGNAQLEQLDNDEQPLQITSTNYSKNVFEFLPLNFMYNKF